MRSPDVARLMVQLLLVAPEGSYAYYDNDTGEVVFVVSGGALMNTERRYRLVEQLDATDRRDRADAQAS